MKKVTKIDFIKLEKQERIYNFNIDDFHTYFVGNNNLLVHNDGCDVNAVEMRKYTIEPDEPYQAF